MADRCDLLDVLSDIDSAQCDLTRLAFAVQAIAQTGQAGGVVDSRYMDGVEIIGEVMRERVRDLVDEGCNICGSRRG